MKKAFVVSPASDFLYLAFPDAFGQTQAASSTATNQLAGGAKGF
ncbi:hypothetical protein VOM14_31070 [Paraburkholderia sp. MPAMCS5]|nr:hypothetical protein [Paraburkholderia sp. MPAMCS5]